MADQYNYPFNVILPFVISMCPIYRNIKIICGIVSMLNIIDGLSLLNMKGIKHSFLSTLKSVIFAHLNNYLHVIYIK